MLEQNSNLVDKMCNEFKAIYFVDGFLIVIWQRVGDAAQLEMVSNDVVNSIDLLQLQCHCKEFYEECVVGCYADHADQQQ